ncbi:MAG: phage terminase large subunit [Spirochaetia bacterium]|jgi:phage terminase large subunit|nr:phage terminase large subunit [Spirochaetia bacterium]
MRPSWLNRIIGSKLYKLNRHDNYISLYNGSEIWIGGLGDKEQVDRILGHEYNTIYFNEVSQISYHAVTTAYSRLAMKIPGCRNLFLYDCNPASPLHWSYRVFIRKLDFKTDTPIVRPEMYESMLINPEDNRANLAEDYIEDVLEILPEKQKARFRYGQWVKGEGCIYDRFTEEMIIAPADLPEMEYYTGGQDFGLNIAGVKIGYHKDKTYVVADHGGHNITTKTFNDQLKIRNWYNDDFPVYCDPAGGERIQEITGGTKANNAVDSGIDYINSLIERERFYISSVCTGVLSEIWDYSRDEDDKIVKINDHYMDAVRYAIFSSVQQGVIIG